MLDVVKIIDELKLMVLNDDIEIDQTTLYELHDKIEAIEQYMHAHEEKHNYVLG